MPWPLEALARLLHVELLPSVDSTNSELMRRVRAGRLNRPTLLIAQEQTAGRGRLGRNWHSQADASLTFSLAYPLPSDCAGLSLAVGLSLAESLDREDHTAIRLKWPNDLWLHDRKLAGILIETARQYAVIGVGINVKTCTQVDDGLKPAYLDELHPTLTPQAALLQIVPPLLQALHTFSQTGFAPLHARFTARDALAGRMVYLSNGTHGTTQGINAYGALQVHTAAGMKTITGDEVSVRPLCKLTC